MARFAIVDAPIDCSGAGRGEERAPVALRSAGLAERLSARDAGEADARIRDTQRDPDTGVIGAADVRGVSMASLPVSGRFWTPASVRSSWAATARSCSASSRHCPPAAACGSSMATRISSTEAADRRGGRHGPRDPDRSWPARVARAGWTAARAGAVVLLGHRPAELHPDVARENARIDPAIRALTAPECAERGATRGGDECRRPASGAPGVAASRSGRPRRRRAPRCQLPTAAWPRLGRALALARPLAGAPNLLGVSVADFNPDRDTDGTHAAPCRRRARIALRELAVGADRPPDQLLAVHAAVAVGAPHPGSASRPTRAA